VLLRSLHVRQPLYSPKPAKSEFGRDCAHFSSVIALESNVGP
jgi:hypothetical protein